MTRLRASLPALALGLLAFGLAARAEAKNVDLVTLPEREGVQLTVYASEDLTLVKERRRLTVKRGPNRLQFSWANTLIDPSSVEFRPVEHAAEIEVADTVFSAQKPETLVWNLRSSYEGQALVEVSYFTSGISWSMDYVGVTDPAETRMDLRGHVRVSNRSGEEYEDAEIRLIVGTINLVEKVADLARRRGIPVPGPKDEAALRELRRDGAKEMFEKAADAAARGGAPATEAKGIVKEGLSEYFLFTVEGTETVKDGWSKRMEAVRATDMPFEVVYRLRPHQYGPLPVRFFLWENDEAHHLGGSPLPDGRLRLFRDNGHEGLAVLGEEDLRYVPVRARIEANLGPDDRVGCDTVVLGTERSAFQFHPVHAHVTGWDTTVRRVDHVRNDGDRPVRLELRRQWPGDVEYASEQPTTLFDFQTVEAVLDVPAHGKADVPSTTTTHDGANAKQQRVALR